MYDILSIPRSPTQASSGLGPPPSLTNGPTGFLDSVRPNWLHRVRVKFGRRKKARKRSRKKRKEEEDRERQREKFTGHYGLFAGLPALCGEKGRRHFLLYAKRCCDPGTQTLSGMSQTSKFISMETRGGEKEYSLPFLPNLRILV